MPLEATPTPRACINSYANNYTHTPAKCVVRMRSVSANTAYCEMQYQSLILNVAKCSIDSSSRWFSCTDVSFLGSHSLLVVCSKNGKRTMQTVLEHKQAVKTLSPDCQRCQTGTAENFLRSSLRASAARLPAAVTCSAFWRSLAVCNARRMLNNVKMRSPAHFSREGIAYPVLQSCFDTNSIICGRPFRTPTTPWRELVGMLNCNLTYQKSVGTILNNRYRV